MPGEDRFDGELRQRLHPGEDRKCESLRDEKLRRFRGPGDEEGGEQDAGDGPERGERADLTDRLRGGGEEESDEEGTKQNAPPRCLWSRNAFERRHAAPALRLRRQGNLFRCDAGGRRYPHGTTDCMPTFAVKTAQSTYSVIVDRGCLTRVHEFIPNRAGKLFVASTADVWELHGKALAGGLKGRPYDLLVFPGGETRKRLAEVETLAEQMAAKGGDRSSIVVAFGGGILTDVAGFLAAVFLRCLPVIHVPTPLLAQVSPPLAGPTALNLPAPQHLHDTLP